MTIDSNAVTQAYIEAALWSTSIEEDFAKQHNAAADTGMLDFGFTADDLHPSALVSMRADVADFLAGVSLLDTVNRVRHTARLQYWADELGDGQIGHDFWLTRNGHGTGFWDRFADGTGYQIGRALTDAARPYGESWLYIGDDGLIYVA